MRITDVLLHIAQDKQQAARCMVAYKARKRTTQCYEPIDVLRRAIAYKCCEVLQTTLPPVILQPYSTTASNILHKPGEDLLKSTDAHSSDATYQPGTWHSACKDAHLCNMTLLGSVFMQVGRSVRPVVVYISGNSPRVVFHMFDAPLGQLEAQLYAPNTTPSVFEIRWHGETFAHLACSLRADYGTYLRANIDPEEMSNALYDGRYHLVREGIFPLLHLRQAVSTNERHMLRETQAAFKKCFPCCKDSTSPLNDLNVFAPEQALTIFDRCPLALATASTSGVGSNEDDSLLYVITTWLAHGNVEVSPTCTAPECGDKCGEDSEATDTVAYVLACLSHFGDVRTTLMHIYEEETELCKSLRHLFTEDTDDHKLQQCLSQAFKKRGSDASCDYSTLDVMCAVASFVAAPQTLLLVHADARGVVVGALLKNAHSHRHVTHVEDIIRLVGMLHVIPILCYANSFSTLAFESVPRLRCTLTDASPSTPAPVRANSTTVAKRIAEFEQEAGEHEVIRRVLQRMSDASKV